VEAPIRGRSESEERSQEESSEEEGADVEAHDHTPPLLVAVPAVLVAMAVIAGLVPELVPSAERAAAHFRDHASYAGTVLAGHAPQFAPVAESHVKVTAWLYALASTAGAFVLAWVGLRGRSILPVGIADALRAAHSGHIGDYIAWWTFGMAIFGGLVLWAVTG
jgi:multicomponent Na+:H+ antiporter subunit D